MWARGDMKIQIPQKLGLTRLSPQCAYRVGRTHKKESLSVRDSFIVRERMMGFEPTTSTLARLRSTTELHPRFLCFAPVAVWRGSGDIIHICTVMARLFLKKMDFFAVFGGEISGISLSVTASGCVARLFFIFAAFPAFAA